MIKLFDNKLYYEPDNRGLSLLLKFKSFELNLEDVAIIGLRLKLILDEECYYFVIIDNNKNKYFIHGSPSNLSEIEIADFMDHFGIDSKEIKFSNFQWRDFELKKTLTLYPAELKGTPLFRQSNNFVGRIVLSIVEIFRINFLSKKCLALWSTR